MDVAAHLKVLDGLAVRRCCLHVARGSSSLSERLDVHFDRHHDYVAVLRRGDIGVRLHNFTQPIGCSG